MDLHDLGRGRGGLESAMARIRVPDAGRSASLATCSTRLPAAADPRAARPPRDADASYVEIDSPHGHDAFLIELDQVGEPIGTFLDEVAKRR